MSRGEDLMQSIYEVGEQILIHVLILLLTISSFVRG